MIDRPGFGVDGATEGFKKGGADADRPGEGRIQVRFVLIRLTVVLALLTPVVGSVHGDAAAGEPALFSNAVAARNVETGVVRAVTADVNQNLLPEAGAVGIALGLEVAGGEYTLEPLTSGSSARAWKGTPRNSQAASLLLIENGEAVSGSIRTGNSTLIVEPLGPGRVLVRELDPAFSFGRELEPPVPPTAPPFRAVPETAGRDAGGETFDLLVLYTPAARAAMGGEAAAQAFAQERVAELNLLFENSEIGLRARLAGATEVSYSEGGASGLTMLQHLTDAGDGFMDEAHTLREAYGADVVSLLVGSMGDAGGIAWIMNSVGPWFAPWAFNVSTVAAAQTSLTMSHEIGHNLGSDHDRANAGDSRAYPYSFGHRVPGLFRTVMAYPCEYQGLAGCPRLPNFSNPDVGHLGYATGVPIGEALQADNATGFYQAGPVVAAFRPSTATLCRGLPVTLPGTNASETLVGTDGPDVIDGRGGDDVIKGLGGDDVICAGTGDDTVYGGTGDDIVYGGNGADLLNGGAGDDGLYGGRGDDLLYGANGSDLLKGNAEDDQLNGGAGGDTLDGGDGSDLARGNGGWDLFLPGPGADTLIGGAQIDRVDFRFATGPVTVDLAARTAVGDGIGTVTLSQIERVRATDYDDIIWGDAGANQIRALAGADFVRGRGGPDTVYGNAGDDDIAGNSGDDVLRGNTGTDLVNGGPGVDACSAETTVACE